MPGDLLSDFNFERNRIRKRPIEYNPVTEFKRALNYKQKKKIDPLVEKWNKILKRYGL
jgi:hypothetical protein